MADGPCGAWTGEAGRAIPRFRESMGKSAADTTTIDLGIPAERFPRHVGIIMDGNGRWATLAGLPRSCGHDKGADAVRDVVRTGRRAGLSALTLFSFSSQNWNRPQEEVFHLMNLLRRYLIEERSEILDNQIRLTTVGDTHRLPGQVREPLEELMEVSANNTGMVLCLALSYGGREIIASTARELCRKAQAGELDPDEVTPDLFQASLPSSACLPELDLLIRTSGEQRVSNFFLWEVAYAELFFSPILWPDFSGEQLLEAIREYSSRDRRYGLTPMQAANR